MNITEEIFEVDDQCIEDTFDDASDLDLTSLIRKLANTESCNVTQDENGNYISSHAQEEVLLELEDDEAVVELGRGRRKKQPNQRFNARFWMMH
jgi:hypothetical protein